MKEFTAENQSRLEELTKGEQTRGPRGFLSGVAIGVFLWALIFLAFYFLFLKG